MIRFENVTKVYKEVTHAVNDVTINIDKGEFVFLVGQSGSGKSTILRLITAEEVPTDGHVHVAGKDLARISSRRVPYLRRNIGSVFQDFKLLPQKSVYENVAFTKILNLTTDGINFRVSLKQNGVVHIDALIMNDD